MRILNRRNFLLNIASLATAPILLSGKDILAQTGLKVEVPIKSYDLQETVFKIESQTEKLKKDEFETQEKYFERIKKLLDNTTIENSRKLSEFVLEFDAKESNHQNSIYNADSQFFNILPSIPPFSVIQEVSKSKYKGKHINLTAYKPSMNNFVFKISPERAKKIAPKLRMGFWGLPVGLFTLDHLNYVTLFVYLTRIVCFDSETGDIYYGITIHPNAY